MSTRKKIAWLSPFGPRSDIGAHSLAVVRAMHRRAAEFDCELVLFVKPNGAVYRSEAPRILMGPQFDLKQFSLYDATVLNLGNNHENHGIINETALTRGGIVVAHDIVMQYYIAWQTLQHLHLPLRFADIMSEYYGPRAIDLLMRSGLTLRDQVTRYSPWDSDYALDFPLIEPFLERAQAVVVHSQFAADIVSGMTDAPLLRLFLPSDKKAAPERLTPSSDGKVRFVAIGHYSRAKQLQLCIEAFLFSDVLRREATLRIAGGKTDDELIRELLDVVRENNLQETVKFEFNVTEQRLYEIKCNADVFLNLRFPNIESASGSLAEEMACGVPVIVHDSGCFSELPDDAVLKIRDISSSYALGAEMEKLAGDAQLRQTIGARAREHGRTRRADDYAVQFLRFVRDNEFAAPMKPRSGSEPFPWLDVELDIFSESHRRAPDLFWPQDRPVFRALAKLDADSVAQYLSVAIFRASFTPEAMREIAEIVAASSPERWALLVARLAFLARLLEASAAVTASEFDLVGDAETLLIVGKASPSGFVTLLYLLMLGRGAKDKEIDVHLPFLSDHGPGALMRSFAASAEFQRRSPSRQVVASIADCAEEMDRICAQKNVQRPVLSAGEELAAKALGDSLHRGWHQLEPDGVWSSAQTARLQIKLNADRRPRGLALRLRVLQPPDGEPQGVMVSVNDGEIVYAPIADGNPFTLKVPLANIDEATLDVRLSVDKIVRLADHGPEGDPRALGLFIYEIAAT